VLNPEIREIGPVILVADVLVAAAVGWLFGAVGFYARVDFGI
jgi:agmatine/peptidylarginine deiminase